MIEQEWASQMAMPLDPDTAAALEQEIRQELLQLSSISPFTSTQTITNTPIPTNNNTGSRSPGPWIPVQSGPSMEDPVMEMQQYEAYQASEVRDMNELIKTHLTNDTHDNWEPLQDPAMLESIQLAEAFGLAQQNQEPLHVCPVCSAGHLASVGGLVGCTRCPLRLRFQVSNSLYQFISFDLLLG
ncbi:hypothetical protein HDV05_006456 [Chytridiales sp. JEL 0842]|nr:hypothetical protein HDV05_006456 [Chytridiales sp. JEL 0842]